MAVDGCWRRLAVISWWLVVDGGWRRLMGIGWQLVAVGDCRLAVVGWGTVYPLS